MPPYFSVDCTFENKRITSDFVERMYSCIFQNGFTFKSGYTKYDVKLPLNKIIRWNQQKLEQGFRLGDKQHYKYNYKQVLFNSTEYMHMRGIFSYREDESSFSIIVPEDDVLLDECSLNFIEDKISPLRKLAVSLWQNDLADAIQSSAENGGCCSLEIINTGKELIDIPFAIVCTDVIKNFDANFFHGKQLVSIENNGTLITNPNPSEFLTYWRNKSS